MRWTLGATSQNAEEEEVPLSLECGGGISAPVSRRDRVATLFYNNSYNECDALAQTTLRPSNLKLQHNTVKFETAPANLKLHQRM